MLNPASFMTWLDEKLRSIGTAACPPYHLAVVIGGTLCPLLYPLAGDWAILYAGFVGGTLSAFIIRFASLRADKERS